MTQKTAKSREIETLSSYCENELPTGNDAINCMVHVMKSTAKV